MPALSKRRGHGRAINEINMVPFIDVMLVLLIIFMVTAPLITPSVINVPSAGQAAQPPEKRVDIQIDAQGQISLAGEIKKDNVTEEEALADIKTLLAQDPDTPVMIAADKELRYQQVITIMSDLRRAGVRRVGLAVQK
jgi:biopolymer transport protein TolR